MTTSLSFDATDEELLDFVRTWVDLLAAEKYEEAFNMLVARPAYPGRSWCPTAQSLRGCVEGYGVEEPEWDEIRHKISPRAEALGDETLFSVMRESSLYPDFVASLDYWLPVDGEWSDLMASIHFVRGDDCLHANLVALRVP